MKTSPNLPVPDNDEDAVAVVKPLTGGAGADYVVECAGTEATKIHTHKLPLADRPTALRYARRRIHEATAVVLTNHEASRMASTAAEQWPPKGQRPSNFGARFSMNALIPSCMSCVLNRGRSCR